MAQEEKCGIIEDLKKKDNIIVLTLSDEVKKNWQLPTKVVEYVRNNFNKIGSIDTFEIYEK